MVRACLLHKYKLDFRLSDLVLFPYLLAVIRQFFWIIPSDSIAWISTFICAAVLCLALSARRLEDGETRGFAFWFIVGGPLLFMYFIRVMFPDFSYDVLNYHLINGERALHGLPWAQGDFFPGILPVNPAPDMILGMMRHLLGYRLGTVANLMALLWAGAIIERMLRPYISSKYLRYSGALLAISTDLTLFLIPRYMVDLLAVPLLLHAAELALAQDKFHSDACARHLRIAILLGIAICLKLTNVAFAIPIVLLDVWRVRHRIRPRKLITSMGLLVLPSLPFSMFLYQRTASPLFPFYNALFRSPYMEARNIQDSSHGPHGSLETITWPLVGSLYATRVGSVVRPGRPGLYSGRLFIGVLASIAALVLPGIRPYTRRLAFLVLTSAGLWSVTAGEVRYGFCLEILGAAVLLCLIGQWGGLEPRALSLRGPYRKRALRCGVLLVVQTSLAYAIAIVSQEPTFPQSTIFHSPKRTWSEAKHLLNDYSALQFLTPEQRLLVHNVDVWIASAGATSGLESTFQPDAPVVSTHSYVQLANYFDSPGARAALRRALRLLRAEKMYTLVWASEIDEARINLAAQGFNIVNRTTIFLPFYSPDTRLPLILMRVAPCESCISDEQQAP